MSHKTAAELRVVVKVSPESEKEHALKSIVKRNSGESCLVLWPVNTSCQTDCSSVCRSVTHFTRYSTVYKTLTASALEIFSGTLCSSSVGGSFSSSRPHQNHFILFDSLMTLKQLGNGNSAPRFYWKTLSFNNSVYFPMFFFHFEFFCCSSRYRRKLLSIYADGAVHDLVRKTPDKTGCTYFFILSVFLPLLFCLLFRHRHFWCTLK